MESREAQVVFVSCRDVRLHVVVQGVGPAVLLLHGFPDDHRLWTQQVEALAKAGYQAIAPDLRGCGLSDKPADAAAYNLKHVVQDLLMVLDQFGINTAVVVGHDWGAATAWRLAMSAPHRVEKLVVLSVGHPGAGVAAGGMKQRAKFWYYLFFQYVGVAEAALQANDWQLFREFLGSGVDSRMISSSVDGSIELVSRKLQP